MSVLCGVYFHNLYSDTNARVDEYIVSIKSCPSLLPINKFYTVNLDIFASIYFCEFKQKTYRFIFVLLIFANSFKFNAENWSVLHIVNSFNSI